MKEKSLEKNKTAKIERKNVRKEERKKGANVG
jgi:hypothetical protein